MGFLDFSRIKSEVPEAPLASLEHSALSFVQRSKQSHSHDFKQFLSVFTWFYIINKGTLVTDSDTTGVNYALRLFVVDASQFCSFPSLWGYFLSFKSNMSIYYRSSPHGLHFA